MPNGTTTAPEEVAVERGGDGVAGLVTAPSAGVYALAAMSDAEFEKRLEQMRKGRDRVRAILHAFMQEGVHYYKPPGRENDPEAQFGLSKAGAEVLCQLYGYVPEPVLDAIEYGDPENRTSPAIRVRFRCLVHLGTLEGPVVGVGFGAANTWEVKYRYRKGTRTCPACERETLFRSKYPNKEGEFKGLEGWYCNAKAGGCGRSFPNPKEASIIIQVVGRVANEDSQDLENTLLKMGEKRCKVDGSITASAASDLFTQDVEDLEGEGQAGKPGGAGSVPGGAKQATTAAAPPAGEAPAWVRGQGARSGPGTPMERFVAAARRVGATKNKDLMALAAAATGLPLQKPSDLSTLSAEDLERCISRAEAMVEVSPEEAPVGGAED